jgi:hypothetical protein
LICMGVIREPSIVCLDPFLWLPMILLSSHTANYSWFGLTLEF